MSIEVGTIVSGKVTGITNFGAFIDLGDRKTGLVHISEISDSYIKDINEVLNVGDEVKVKVMTIAADGKIGLSIRKAQENSNEGSQPQREHKPAPRTTSSYNKPREDRPSYNKGKDYRDRAPQGKDSKKDNSFDSLMSAFLKDSDDRLTSLKRNTEGKRGGRGGRRS